MKRLLLTLIFGLSLSLAGGGFYLWNYQASIDPQAQLPEVCAAVLRGMQAQPLEGVGSECVVRRWYRAQVDKIAEVDPLLRDSKVDSRRRALCAYSIRRQARILARRHMSSGSAVLSLRLRDWLKYGRPEGPAFTDLLDREGGVQADLRIIESAQRTHLAFDKHCGL